MKNYRKHIDDFFREKLGSYREAPPADAWGELEGRLDELKPIPPGTSYRWMWHFAMVSLIAILSISLGRKLLTGTKDEPSKQLAANETGSTTNQATAPATPASNAGAPAAQNNAPIENPATATDAGNKPGGSAATTAIADNGKDDQKGAAKGNVKKNNHPIAAKHNSGARNTFAANPTSNGKKQTGNNNTTPTNNNYQGHINNPAPDEVNDNDQKNNNELAASPSNTLSPDATKKDEKEVVKNTTDQKTKNNPPVNNNKQDEKQKKNKIGFNRFEAGIKTGYEGGFEAGAANKFVVSPYVQFNISPKLAVMLQPAFKAANTANRNIGTPQAYYKTNEDGKITTDYISPNTVTIGATIDTYSYSSKYTYTQTHDSIVKSYRTGGTYMELELPILLKYALSKKFAVYGGVNLVYSKTMGITENTFNAKGIMRSMDKYDTTTLYPIAPPSGLGLTYNGTPYSNYNGPLYTTTTSSDFKLGYMVGFSYTMQQRWLFDALVQQAPAQSEIKGGYNINTPLSSTYFRLTIGYKLTK
jgi:hypothetical protein